MISAEDLEITDLFEDEDDIGNAGNGLGNGRTAEEDENGSADEANRSSVTDAKATAAKRIVRNPQPKLNPERLCGDRGIVQLQKIYSEIKFKGKGHEKDDLDKVMKTLEHWAHRLYPKFTFDDVLETVERLGSKKVVQNCIRRIRMDLPILEEDYVNDNVDDDPNDAASNAPAVPDNQLHTALFGNASTSQTSVAPELTADIEPINMNTLTDEQRERSERNRLLAIERRAARWREAKLLTANTTQDILSATKGTNSDSSLLTDELVTAFEDDFEFSAVSDCIKEKVDTETYPAVGLEINLESEKLIGKGKTDLDQNEIGGQMDDDSNSALEAATERAAEEIANLDKQVDMHIVAEAVRKTSVAVDQSKEVEDVSTSENTQSGNVPYLL